MTEERTIKISVPIITEEEIRQIDNNIKTSVNQFVEQIVHNKELKIAQHIIQKLQEENNNKDKIISKIQNEVREHIGFENRLKKDNREPDMFNQGRFYVANNIKCILKQAKEV